MVSVGAAGERGTAPRRAALPPPVAQVPLSPRVGPAGLVVGPGRGGGVAAGGGPGGGGGGPRHLLGQLLQHLLR